MAPAPDMVSAASPAPPSSPPPRVYSVKWVLDEHGRATPIVLQGSNGPCALLALLNVQFQRGSLTLPVNTPQLSEPRAMSMLADLAARGAATLADAPAAQLQRESAVQHFVELLPGLARGMHVNVRFSAPTAFEFTKEIAAFDCFPDVQLVHGWLVDPQDELLARAFGNMSYNQVMDELVRLNDAVEPLPASSDSSPTPSAPPALGAAAAAAAGRPAAGVDEVLPTRSPSTSESGVIDIALPPHLRGPPARAPARSAPSSGSSAASSSVVTPAEEDEDEDDVSPAPAPSAVGAQAGRVWEFFDSFPTMLTYAGIVALQGALREDELAILFRNSHFYVLRKRGERLYTLVSDQGFAREQTVVWELLRDINGDSDFYDAAFVPAAASSAGIPPDTAAPKPPKPKPPQAAQRPPAAAAGSRSRREIRAIARRGGPPGAPAPGGPPAGRKSKRDEACCVQ